MPRERTLSRTLPITILVLLASGIPAVAQGQTDNRPDPDCDVYADCALRIQHNLLSTKVVRGVESAEVARIGFGTPPLRELLSRSEPATLAFHQFRSDHAWSSWLALLGGIEFVGSMVAGARGNDDLAVGLSIGGSVIEVVAGIFGKKASEHLSRSIWWYNQSLTEGGGR